jgi:hypothetical protein
MLLLELNQSLALDEKELLSQQHRLPLLYETLIEQACEQQDFLSFSTYLSKLLKLDIGSPTIPMYTNYIRQIILSPASSLVTNNEETSTTFFSQVYFFIKNVDSSKVPIIFDGHSFQVAVKALHINIVKFFIQNKLIESFDFQNCVTLIGEELYHTEYPSNIETLFKNSYNIISFLGSFDHQKNHLNIHKIRHFIQLGHTQVVRYFIQEKYIRLNQAVLGEIFDNIDQNIEQGAFTEYKQQFVYFLFDQISQVRSYSYLFPYIQHFQIKMLCSSKKNWDSFARCVQATNYISPTLIARIINETTSIITKHISDDTSFENLQILSQLLAHFEDQINAQHPQYHHNILTILNFVANLYLQHLQRLQHTVNTYIIDQQLLLKLNPSIQTPPTLLLRQKNIEENQTLLYTKFSFFQLHEQPAFRIFLQNKLRASEGFISFVFPHLFKVLDLYHTYIFEILDVWKLHLCTDLCMFACRYL